MVTAMSDLYPWTVETDRAWRIAGGAVTALELPPHPNYYQPPEHLPGYGLDGQQVSVMLLPGRVHSDFEAHALSMVAEVATRITPWTTWYAAPGWFGSAEFGGQAWWKKNVAILKATLDPPAAVHVAYHEAWHLCEDRMSPEVLAELDAALAAGPAWPGDYHPRPKERRARAFACFAMLLTEGCRLPMVPGGPSEAALFWHVYSGAFARELLASPPERKVTLRQRAASMLTRFRGYRGLEAQTLVPCDSRMS